MFKNLHYQYINFHIIFFLYSVWEFTIIVNFELTSP